MTDIVLRTQDLTKTFGSLTAVDHLTLEVRRGEIFGFLGPNGAGKTTSIRMMCGLLQPDAGTVWVEGKPVTNGDGEFRKRVGVCPQEIILWERLTAREQLQFTGQMYDLSARLARQRADKLLAELDLTDKRDKQARTLSGGMKRRLNLAMALVHDPDIVVLDEPEAGLDPQSRVKVREYIQGLARHKTVILTTHNMDEAERLADRVAIIDHGKLLVLDTPGALKAQAGEGDVIEIGLTGAPAEERAEAALPRLKEQFPETYLAEDGKILAVRAHNAVNKLPAILDLLHHAGLSPGEIRLRENTLEDVFIQLTGRSLRQ